MLKHSLILEPRDLLFFRDARPMEAGDAGRGANWPLPSVLHEALLAALQSALPEDAERQHLNRNRKDRNWDGQRAMRFGGLRTLGPWPLLPQPRPSRNGQAGLPAGLYLPAPVDLVPLEGERPREPQPDAHVGYVPALRLGACDLPGFLRPVARTVPPSKETCGEWLAVTEFAKYLRNEPCRTTAANELCGVEHRIGIGIDAATHSTQEHQFYSAEYLRLARDVVLAAWAECPTVGVEGATGDAIGLWLPKEESRADLILGGQRGLVSVRRAEERLAGPFALQGMRPKPTGDALRVKWVLLSPAVFGSQKPMANDPGHAGGWLPSWIDSRDGTVKLRVVPRELRNQRRQAAKTAKFDLDQDDAVRISARLVAALVPKPLAFSGWDLIAGGPKPTHLAVPAGAVYYFECDSAAAARALVQSLHGRVKSDLFGEKGFGFGVCGTWAQG